MARHCRGKRPALTLLTVSFLLYPSIQEAQIGAEAAQPPEMKILLERQIADQHLAGMAAIVVRAESVVGIAAAGVKKQGENSQIDVGDLFHLGSNTKAITATMVARLIEAGKLSFTTTPLDVFPELKDTIHPALK